MKRNIERSREVGVREGRYREEGRCGWGGRWLRVVASPAEPAFLELPVRSTKTTGEAWGLGAIHNLSLFGFLHACMGMACIVA